MTKPRREITNEVIPVAAEIWIVHEPDGVEEWICYEKSQGQWMCVLMSKGLVTIASAEARARLELIERIVHYKKEFHEVGSRESNAIQFILNQIQLDRLAAASTPDRPTAVDGTCCSCGYSGEDETPCPKQEDGHHCIHWYEGESPDSTKEPE